MNLKQTSQKFIKKNLKRRKIEMRKGTGFIGKLKEDGKITKEEAGKIRGIIFSLSATSFGVGILFGLTIAIMVL